MKKNNKGFTLVELIVVIAILGVLMAVLVPQYIQYVDKSKAGTDLSTLGEALHAAEVAAALNTPADPYTLSCTDGVITVDADLKDTLGEKITLKSSALKDLDDTALAIAISADGKATLTAASETQTAIGKAKTKAGSDAVINYTPTAPAGGNT